MNLRLRKNVSVMGNGRSTLVFSHGFGCNQAMWHDLAPPFTEHFRVVMYDLVGAGLSDLSAFDKHKYSALDGYARDLNELIDAFAVGPVILVSHSVSAMIATLADRQAPGRIAAHVMIGPSPRYIDADGYVGGFKRSDIDDLLDTLDSNYLGWSSAMAPVIMGAPEQPALSEALTRQFLPHRTGDRQAIRAGDVYVRQPQGHRRPGYPGVDPAIERRPDRPRGRRRIPARACCPAAPIAWWTTSAIAHT